MPFTTQQFFEVFARYNAGVWPAQVVLNALALLVIALVIRGRPAHGRWIAAVLAVLWAWMAVAYHFAYFVSINPAAWFFGALSLAGALWLAWIGIGKGQLHFALGHGVRSWVGAALVVFSLVLYPLLGYLQGHRYPAVPTFGLPCPTTIFTIGVLLFAQAPVPRSTFIVPVLWALIGSTAAFALGVYQDLGLLAAGVVAVIAMIRPPTFSKT
jgi:hypothetical protein